MPSQRPRLPALGIAATIGLGLTLLLTARSWFDAFQAPKAVVIWATAVVVLVLLAQQAMVRRQVPRLTIRDLAVFGMVPLALTASLVVSDSVLGSLVGEVRRHGGVLTYASLAVLSLALVAVTRSDERLAVRAGLVIGGAAALSLVVPALQLVGIEVAQWGNEGDLTGLTGNVNFTAAVAGIVLGPSLVGAVAARTSWHRLLGAAVALMAVAVAVGTGTSQGIFLVLAAPLLPAVAWLRERHPTRVLLARRLGVPAIAMGIILVVLGMFAVGPLQALGQERNVAERRTYWATAVDMYAAHPVLGVGADRYAVNERQHRPASLAERRDPLVLAFDPHDVPLAMAANAGTVGLAAHLAMIVLVGWSLFQGLRRRSGPALWWLTAVGSAWLAYQIQSLVSLDIPPLMVLHAATAALIVAMAGGPDEAHVREARATAARQAKRGGKRGRKAPPVRPLWQPVGMRAAFAGSALALGLAGLLAWASLATIRTNPVLQRGRNAYAAGEMDQAADLFAAAASASTWRADTLVFDGLALKFAQGPTQAVAAFNAALERAPGEVWAMLELLNVQLEMGDLDGAAITADRLVTVDPQLPQAWLAVSRVAAGRGDHDEAIRTAQLAVDRGDLAVAWLGLAEALEGADRIDEAVLAVQGALERDAGSIEAQILLAGLTTAG